MTDKLREAAEAALDALETVAIDAKTTPNAYEAARKATVELRAALAEQDAEPYLWYADDTGDTWTPDAVAGGWAPTDLRPLYTHPPRRSWVGLTDEEIEVAWKACDPKRLLPSFTAEIEAALRDKNGG